MGPWSGPRFGAQIATGVGDRAIVADVAIGVGDRIGVRVGADVAVGVGDRIGVRVGADVAVGVGDRIGVRVGLDVRPHTQIGLPGLPVGLLSHVQRLSVEPPVRPGRATARGGVEQATTAPQPRAVPTKNRAATVPRRGIVNVPQLTMSSTRPDCTANTSSGGARGYRKVDRASM